MITKLTQQEREQLLSCPRILKLENDIRATLPFWATSIEWYKQVINKDCIVVKQGQNHKIGNEHVIIHAIFIKPVSTIDIRQQRDGRNPMFALRRPQSPTYKVVHINFSLMCLLEDGGLETRITQSTIETQFIPNLGNGQFASLADAGCLGTIFNTHGNIIFPGEVGLDIPFFKGTQRLHRECLRHGRIQSKKPLPRNLLEGAVWYNTEQQPL